MADLLMISLRESGHPLFRGTSALFRGASEKKSKGGGRTSTHCNAERRQSCHFASLFQYDQFSVHGAVSDWCEELAQQITDHSSSSTGKPVAEVNDESEPKVAPTAH